MLHLHLLLSLLAPADRGGGCGRGAGGQLVQLSPASDWVPRLLQLLSLLRPSRLQLGGEGVVDTDLRHDHDDIIRW